MKKRAPVESSTAERQEVEQHEQQMTLAADLLFMPATFLNADASRNRNIAHCLFFLFFFSVFRRTNWPVCYRANGRHLQYAARRFNLLFAPQLACECVCKLARVMTLFYCGGYTR